MKPTRKVAAGGVTGALATIIVWVASQTGVEVPPDVAAAFATLMVLAGSWLTRDAR